ncbi:diacylglycerol/lipid kinase family protein [Prevotella sp. OH937_COT-195]|uniref:diacylglycerol/lipid kinase family protein n=1 Tax=Prevotella sp. OH937_COT-195 TaxID=2491051 RepID=UPI000F64635E|nr:YegS/Rv2252/BmrU family lipid kinase [Prevotella sp. OH937_COT-195]RRD02891.1 YegS/Rv2252/BmrU family lipid kinase [Prevotella sp. OH937_COT-195]
MKKEITFIMNPISGTVSKAGLPELIERTIDKDKFNYDIVFTERAGHATLLAADAAEKGKDIVVAVGGDGTVNEIGRALVHTDTAMAILPCGSGNGLARHLMIPMNLKKSIETINRCVIHELDYGVINDMPFFCTCGMGFDAFVSMKFAEAGRRGPIAYVENVLREGLRYKPETYIITDESGTKQRKAFLISCANASQYGNNAYIAPQASMSDGMLDVIIMEPFDMFDATQISIDLFAKTIGNNSKIKMLKASQLSIKRHKEGYIHFDGDPLMTGKEIKIHVEHKGIKIVVNPDVDKSKRKPARVVNAMSEAFNTLRDDINSNRRMILALNKKILRKLNNL